MLRFETLGNDDGNCILEMRGTGKEIETEAAYMFVLIYSKFFNKDPMLARTFRKHVLFAINEACDAIERGDL